MPHKTLIECAEPGPSDPRVSLSKPQCEPQPLHKGCDGFEKDDSSDVVFQGLDADLAFKMEGLGEPVFCNPMTTGQIMDNPDDPPLPPDRSVIYRYAQGFRSIDEAVKKLFENVVVYDEQGKVFRVPIMWGSQERAVAAILQTNVRKDNSGVVDRVVLPFMSVYTSSYAFPRERFISEMAVDYFRGTKHLDNLGRPIGSPAGSPSFTHQERISPYDTILGVTRGIPVDLGYTLTIWAKFWQDMNQILNQVVTKFNPLAYIRIQGVTLWESTVRIDSVSNNLDTEPGDMNNRVFKFQISLTAESYVPQPIVRRKAVLKTETEIVDNTSDLDIANIIARIEEAVGDIA